MVFMPSKSTPDYLFEKVNQFLARSGQFEIQETLGRLHIPGRPGASLFFFATRSALITSNPLTHTWQDGNGRDVRLI
jgi:hypothetical protein